MKKILLLLLFFIWHINARAILIGEDRSGLNYRYLNTSKPIYYLYNIDSKNPVFSFNPDATGFMMPVEEIPSPLQGDEENLLINYINLVTQGNRYDDIYANDLCSLIIWIWNNYGEFEHEIIPTFGDTIFSFATRREELEQEEKESIKKYEFNGHVGNMLYLNFEYSLSSDELSIEKKDNTYEIALKKVGAYNINVESDEFENNIKYYQDYNGNIYVELINYRKLKPEIIVNIKEEIVKENIVVKKEYVEVPKIVKEYIKEPGKKEIITKEINTCPINNPDNNEVISTDTHRLASQNTVDSKEDKKIFKYLILAFIIVLVLILGIYSLIKRKENVK